MPCRQQEALVEPVGQCGPADNAGKLPRGHRQQQRRHQIGPMHDIASDIEQHPAEAGRGKAGQHGEQPHAQHHRVAQRHRYAIACSRYVAPPAAGREGACDHGEREQRRRSAPCHRQPIECLRAASLLDERRQDRRDGKRRGGAEQQPIARHPAPRAAVARHLRHQRIVRHVDHRIGAAENQQRGRQGPKLTRAQGRHGVEQREGESAGRRRGDHQPAIAPARPPQPDDQPRRHQIEQKIAAQGDQHHQPGGRCAESQHVGEQEQDGEVRTGEEQRLAEIARGISEHPCLGCHVRQGRSHQGLSEGRQRRWLACAAA